MRYFILKHHSKVRNHAHQYIIAKTSTCFLFGTLFSIPIFIESFWILGKPEPRAFNTNFSYITINIQVYFKYLSYYFWKNVSLFVYSLFFCFYFEQSYLLLIIIAFLFFVTAHILHIKFSAIQETNLWNVKLWDPFPIGTGRKLNVHETLRRLRLLLNVFCTFNLRPVSTGICTSSSMEWSNQRHIVGNKAKGQISKPVFQEKKAGQIFSW